ncbi:patatin-like phospholipase family protein [Thermodesulfobacteriota bacterium]
MNKEVFRLTEPKSHLPGQPLLDRIDKNGHQRLNRRCYMGFDFVFFKKPTFILDGFKTTCALGFLLVFAGLSACTAHYPQTSPIQSIKPLENFSVKKEEYTQRSKELLLFLTFSGGGTRAAAFSYGLLEALADINISIQGNERRLLDEVDIISSVSGGSFTAAYFGLFGDRVFEDFEDKFLKHDVQSELRNLLLSPLNWPKLWSLYYDRSDLAAEYYDELLFEKKTFIDFFKTNGPSIAVNATDAALGSQFTFNGSQFAPICTDLSSFSVSRAVTASSAVPGVFSSVILKNYAGTCDYQMPKWAVDALKGKKTSTRQYYHAKDIKAYLDVKSYPYIHLFDGGISDNLGIRAFINATLETENFWKKIKNLNLEQTRNIVIIVVNSRNEQDVSFAKKDYSIPFVDTLGLAASIPLDHYSFETMEVLKDNMSHYEKSISAKRCKEMKNRAVAKGENESMVGDDCKLKTYLIEVGFDAMEDEAEKKHLKDLPTSFRLKPEDVDRLRRAARQILHESAEFQDLLERLK